MKIKAGIMGGAGYTGGELIRLLIHHPQVELMMIHSKSMAGKKVYAVHRDLLGDTELSFSDQLNTDLDVLFLCAGHGEARNFLSEYELPKELVVIDLSHDFRLTDSRIIGEREFVYGLPELNKNQITQSGSVANPGCFATAIQLGLLPLAKAGWSGDVYTTGITGSTGAGQSLSETSHFSWRSNNIQAYKSLSHQHLHEIKESLTNLSGKNQRIHFVPWRGDFTRGIYVSSTMSCHLPLEDVYDVYTDFYSGAAFTYVSEEMIDLKQVVNTNKCVMHLEKKDDMLVVHSALDNLLKGASGQAVQNMNLIFNLNETTGLQLKGSAF